MGRLNNCTNSARERARRPRVGDGRGAESASRSRRGLLQRHQHRQGLRDALCARALGDIATPAGQAAGSPGGVCVWGPRAQPIWPKCGLNVTAAQERPCIPEGRLTVRRPGTGAARAESRSRFAQPPLLPKSTTCRAASVEIAPDSSNLVRSRVPGWSSTRHEANWPLLPPLLTTPSVSLPSPLSKSDLQGGQCASGPPRTASRRALEECLLACWHGIRR